MNIKIKYLIVLGFWRLDGEYFSLEVINMMRIIGCMWMGVFCKGVEINYKE